MGIPQRIETHAPPSDRIHHQAIAAGVTPRSIAVALLFSLLAGIWVRQSEIVALTTQITESVPAIPALTTLIMLIPINSLLRRHRSINPLTMTEIMVVFFFVCVSSTVMGFGVSEFLLALICVPFYSLTDPRLGERIPTWLAPHDTTVVRQAFEGSPHGNVPWASWIGPGAAWLFFLVALWTAMYSMTALFFRAWSKEEKLSFPLVTLCMEVVTVEEGRKPFFRNPVMWIGFAVAGVYNLVNIAHSFLPFVPAIPQQFNLHEYVTTPPWSALGDVDFKFRPELFGLGFLVQTDLSFSIWISYVLLKLSAVIGTMHDLGPTPGGEPFPYGQEQGLGAFLILAITLVWRSRGFLRGSLAAARKSAGTDRYLITGLALGFCLAWGFAIVAGMAAWVSFVFLSIVLAVALVYARIRAEAGIPLNWLFPYGLQKDVLFYGLGSSTLSATSSSTPTLLTLFSFVSRGYFPELTGYQMEAMEAVRRSEASSVSTPRAMLRLSVALLLAMITGVALGWYLHLSVFYHQGALHKMGGMWGSGIAEGDYPVTIQSTAPSVRQGLATVTGVGVEFVLLACRKFIVGFPLHPLGYAAACSYGNLIWWPFFVVWLAKSIIVRYGGLPLYRKAIPFFLGFALGHFAVAGIIWGIVGAFFGDAVHGYQVWFG